MNTAFEFTPTPELGPAIVRPTTPESRATGLQQQYQDGMRSLMDEEARLASLKAQEASRSFGCSDGRQTGYELKVKTNGFGTSLFLYLEQGDAYRTKTVFTELTAADAESINAAFSRLPNTVESADTLRMYIQNNPTAVLRWARMNDGSPLTSIRLPEPPKPFDYEPYQNFERTFPLPDGTSLRCQTNPEPTAYRVRFEFSTDGGRSSTVYPVDVMDSGTVLAAIQALPSGPEVGSALVQRMQTRGLITALVRQELLPTP